MLHSDTDVQRSTNVAAAAVAAAVVMHTFRNKHKSGQIDCDQQ